jgi:hypothetical protein
MSETMNEMRQERKGMRDDKNEECDARRMWKEEERRTETTGKALQQTGKG